ncbi:hypothetical protein [Streptomyces sp. NPDC048252]|uniref:hypothetical protein n=1 Tax=Streptomyces sp. NPDC048252 TaxID=3154612 RepID=UPI003422A56D
MYQLPEPPAAPAAGQTPHLSDAVLQAAVDHVIEEAKRQDASPRAVIGTAPPVAQPGIPPMGARTTEITRAVMYSSFATIPPGLIAIGIMVASEHADPTVIGMICAAPAVVALPILAIARALRGARPAPDVHQHFHGTVDQRTVHSRTSGVWAKTDNRQ